ncbi:hypothetical protein ACIGNX_29945 [Actinosynnema sp. NPDC053489]|uniref:hypothetical protein n=1 Tax=Actinosynnema sp. NPDC053489 TaxID=3363916 RepID=UPI0037C94948
MTPTKKIGKPRYATALVASVALATAVASDGGSAVAAPPPAGGFLQVVANQDDDILFMNPDRG